MHATSPSFDCAIRYSISPFLTSTIIFTNARTFCSIPNENDLDFCSGIINYPVPYTIVVFQQDQVAKRDYENYINNVVPSTNSNNTGCQHSLKHYFCNLHISKCGVSIYFFSFHFIYEFTFCYFIPL